MKLLSVFLLLMLSSVVFSNIAKQHPKSMPHNVGFMEIGQTGWIRKVEFDPKGDCYVNKHDRVSELHDPKYGYYTKIEKLDTGYKVTAEKRYDIYICKNIDKDIKSPYFVKATFHEGFKLFIELKDMEIGRAYWTNNEALREDHANILRTLGWSGRKSSCSTNSTTSPISAP